MILQCNYANESCGLPGDGGATGEKCGELAERFTEKVSLPAELIRGKGKMVIFSVRQHHESGTNGTGSTN